ncbi:unnamed protein product [Tenebrio molitor]|nr:unnamed protein product [Tenebrio molitor]
MCIILMKSPNPSSWKISESHRTISTENIENSPYSRDHS